MKRPKTEPSGWGFFFRNDHYPDIDDTAMILLALSRAHASDARRRRPATAAPSTGFWICRAATAAGRPSTWTTIGNSSTHVPFADHNAMLDPDLPRYYGPRDGSAGRARVERRASRRAARRRFPAAHISSPMEAGMAAGASPTFTAPASRCAACAATGDMTIAKPPSCAPVNGCARFKMPTAAGAKAAPATIKGCFVPAESTPSQTAWALMGLIAGGDTNSFSVQHGIEYLLETQRPDGGWDEELATGTGFPKVFYLNYHYYRLYFPLIALSDFVKCGRHGQPEPIL